MSNYHWFDDVEVAKWQLQPETWAMLDMARQNTVALDPSGKGIPFIITSGKRTPEQEAALKGGVRDSAHISGYGFDLAVSDGFSLCLMIAGLTAAGFKRLGIYHDTNMVPTHIHGDNDPDLLAKTGPTMWILMEQNA